MIIKVLPSQVPAIWESIKFAASEVNRYPSEKLQSYLTGLMANLMSEKYQAWIVMTEDRKITSIVITHVSSDEGEIARLVIDTAYGFRPSTDEDKADFIADLEQFAREKGIREIIAYSDNPMAQAAMRKVGMVETRKMFTRQVI